MAAVSSAEVQRLHFDVSRCLTVAENESEASTSAVTLGSWRGEGVDRDR